MKKLSIALLSLTLFSSCNQNFIDHADVTLSQNLETIKVDLVFGSSVQSTFSGAYELKQYGELFVDPYSSTEPFEVGFYLNTSVFNDQDYVQINPTTLLPNGEPIGIGYALAEIQAAQPISKDFDIYGYVDVLHQAWLGTSIMFKFLSDKSFVDNMSVSEVLLRDANKLPTVIGAAFGPQLNADGTLKQSAGVSLFANVKSLLGTLKAGELTRLTPESITVKPETK